MFAVIKTGGKQYKVMEGDVLTIEKLDVEAGSTYTFDNVLMVEKGEGDITVGAPTVEGASVTAEVIGPTRGDKIIVFKKKRRHNYRRKHGHRQDLLKVKITGVQAA